MKLSTAKELDFCIACGKCVGSCPIFQITGDEFDGPRGKVIILRQLLKKELKPAIAVESFNACLHCDICTSRCPAKIPLNKIFAEAAQVLNKYRSVNLYQQTAKKLFYGHPLIFDYLQRPVAVIQKRLPASSSVNIINTISKSFPLLANQPYNSKPKQSGSRSPIVIIFQGCLARRALPGVTEATVNILRKLDFEVIIPNELGCCGGAPGGIAKKGIKKLIQKNLKIIKEIDFDYLLTLCPRCQMNIKEFWFAADKEYSREISSKVLDFMDFVRQKISLDLKDDNPVKNNIWHKPCLMDQELSNYIKDFFGLIDLNSSLCCGGQLSFFNDDKSRQRKIADSLISNLRHEIAARQIQSVITGCPGCQLALKNVFKVYSDKISVYHSAQYLQNLLGKKTAIL